MSTQNQNISLTQFLGNYKASLMANAPVRTGTLRSSIGAFATLADNFNVSIEAVSYAKYVNGRNNFIASSDIQIEEFSDEFLEAIWDDFVKDNDKK